MVESESNIYTRVKKSNKNQTTKIYAPRYNNFYSLKKRTCLIFLFHCKKKIEDLRLPCLLYVIRRTPYFFFIFVCIFFFSNLIFPSPAPHTYTLHTLLYFQYYPSRILNILYQNIQNILFLYKLHFS